MMMTLVLALFAGSACLAQSLDGEKYAVYCDVMGYNTMGIGKLKVILDLGGVPSGKQFESIYDEKTGKKMKFNTVIDAVNYLAKRGWRVVTSYPLSEGSRGKVQHFLLEKWVTDDSQVREGMTTKDE